MRMRFRKNQKGQTSIEYLLMIVVAITLGFTFKKRMEEYFFKNPNSFIAGSLRQYRSSFDSQNRYRTFPMVRARSSR